MVQMANTLMGLSNRLNTRRAANAVLPSLAQFFLLAGFILFAFVWFRNAWVSDDAYITLRTVYNVLHGFGPTFNPAERVQTYTHPLWFLLLIPAHALTGEPYYSTLALSYLVSLATLVVLTKYLARTTQQALFAIGAAILSGAFIDFSSSGLENPLSQLTLALFFVPPFKSEYSLRRLFWTSLAASLVVLTRFDLFLIVLPPLALVVFQTWQEHRSQLFRVILNLAAGFVPIALWTVFAVFYYGLLLPNTYYAKTPANVLLEMWVGQGWNYFLHSLRFDPITLVLVGVALVLALRTRDRTLIAIAAGTGLYLLYILRIGGDFMSGRFFTVPFFCALVILTRVRLLGDFRFLVPLAIAAAILGFVAPRPPLFSDETFGATTDPERIALVGPDRVTDQRAFYYHWTGLLRNLEGTKNLEQITEVKEGLEARRRKARILRTTGVGIRSYYAGPTKYVIDEMALADPFLAWLPRKDGWWIVGHFARCPPLGYARTLDGKTINVKRLKPQRNVIQEPQLAEFYTQVSLLTRADLLDSRRILPMIQVNLGSYDHLRAEIYRCENFWSGKPDPEAGIAE